MFVACSTICFAREPLEKALALITDLEFDKYELVLVEDGGPFTPTIVGQDPQGSFERLRRAPSLLPSSLAIDFGPIDWSDPRAKARFDGLCQFAKALGVAVITIPASPLGTPIEDEIKRLSILVGTALREALVISLLTHSQTLTADPRTAVELCKAVPGLGLTLDPSHYLQASGTNLDYTMVYPYVQNVQLRDTGIHPGEFQVRVGQGKIEYAQIVTQLGRHGYKRALFVAIIDREDNPFDREVEVRKLKLLLETLL
jgi:sugar phosphate isomerase/epimerase